MRYHLSSVRMAIIKETSNKSAGEVVVKHDPSFTAGGNGNWYSHYGKTVRKVLQKLRIELPCDPAIPPLYLQRQMHPMFIAALFMVAKTWKQRRWFLIDDWIKMRCRYTMEHYSAIRNDEMLPFVTTWMDLESIMLSKISPSEKVKNHRISLVCKI